MSTTVEQSLEEAADQLLKRYPQGDYPCYPESYLLKRDRARGSETPIEQVANKPLPHWRDCAEFIGLMRRELLMYVWQVHITQRQRTAFIAWVKRGLTQSAIALELNVSQPTVCREIATAKQAVLNYPYCGLVLVIAEECRVNVEEVFNLIRL